MALFKIEKGLSANLANNRPHAHEGYCYFTTDDGKFYIDIAGDGTATTLQELGVNRIALNAEKADRDSAGNVINETYLPRSGGTLTGGLTLNSGGINIKNGTLTTRYITTSGTISADGEITTHDKLRFYGESENSSYPRIVETYIQLPKKIATGASTYTYSTTDYGLYISFPQINKSTGANQSGSMKCIFRTPKATDLGINGVSTSSSTYYLVGASTSGVGSSLEPVYCSPSGILSKCNLTGFAKVVSEITASIDEKYTLVVDTSEETNYAMPLNASKYKDFTINAEDWVESESIYTWTVIANTVTENDAIITLNISADSQGYLMAPLDWETGTNFVKLSTSTKPTGTIKGYFITLPVTVI